VKPSSPSNIKPTTHIDKLNYDTLAEGPPTEGLSEFEKRQRVNQYKESMLQKMEEFNQLLWAEEVQMQQIFEVDAKIQSILNYSKSSPKNASKIALKKPVKQEKKMINKKNQKKSGFILKQLEEKKQELERIALNKKNKPIKDIVKLEEQNFGKKHKKTDKTNRTNLSIKATDVTKKIQQKLDAKYKGRIKNNDPAPSSPVTFKQPSKPLSPTHEPLPTQILSQPPNHPSPKATTSFTPHDLLSQINAYLSSNQSKSLSKIFSFYSMQHTPSAPSSTFQDIQIKIHSLSLGEFIKF
jgi:hypothetical protein